MSPAVRLTGLLLICSVQGALSSILPYHVDQEYKCNVAKNHYDCCYYIKKPFELNSCVTLDYLPDQYGVELKISVNNVDVIDKKVSLRNPPPICEVLIEHKLAELCFYFYNLNVNKSEIDLCMKIDFELLSKDIFNVKLGCYKIPIGLDGSPNTTVIDNRIGVQLVD